MCAWIFLSTHSLLQLYEHIKALKVEAGGDKV